MKVFNKEIEGEEKKDTEKNKLFDIFAQLTTGFEYFFLFKIQKKIMFKIIIKKKLSIKKKKKNK